MQAIRSEELDLTAANFFTADAVDGLTADGPASVLVRRDGGRLSVAVSDPTGTLSTLTLTLDGFGHYRRATTGDPGVQAQLTGRTA